MIYRVLEGGYVISSKGVWLPGVYDNQKTARYAFQFSDEELRHLADYKLIGVITMDDLRWLRKRREGKSE